MSGIYKITCTVNNKSYIGQTSGSFNSRFNSHRSSLHNGKGIQKMQLDWDTYGESKFKFSVVEIIEDKVIRNDKEKYYIQVYDSIKNGYNTSSGGIGQGNFGYLNGMYGKHHSQKSLDLMSTNRKGLTVGSNNGMYGKHHSKQTRDKISESNKGRVQFESEKLYRSKCMKASMLKPENIQARKLAGLKSRKYTDDFVRQLRDEYKDCNSIKDIATKYGLVYETCRQAITGYGRFKDIK